MDKIKLLIIPSILVAIVSYIIEINFKKFNNKLLKNLFIIVLGLLLVVGLVLYSGIGFTDDAVIENQYLIEQLIPYYLSSILGVLLALIKK